MSKETLATIKKISKTPVLKAAEEEEILKNIIDKAKRGEQVLRQDVIRQVVTFIQSDNRKNPFRNGTPGDKWFSLFRRRHNSRFAQLDPKSLRNVEQVGFTEKVTNTVSYAKPTSVKLGPMSLDLPRPKRNKKKKEGGGLLITPKPLDSSEPTSSKMPQPDFPNGPPSSDGEDEGTDDFNSQESQPDNNDFLPGCRLEVMDFNDEKWYPVKVVEVDYEDGEVLVHFEKWSDRYDEWVRMDSNRIRRPQLPQNSSRRVFEKNEKVMAVWAYNLKCPATVRDVLPNDRYEVIFCDGYAKILRGCKLFKASEEDLKNNQPPPPKKPAPPMGADPLDPDLGPKEERRMKKRKIDVLESYLPHKKIKTEASSSVESSPQTFSSPRSSKDSLAHKMMKEESQSQDSHDDDDNRLFVDEGSEPPRKKRRRRRRKEPVEKDPNHKHVYKNRYTPEEDVERWNVEIPEGVGPVQIRDVDGYYRESIVIPDGKLPSGWSKHTMLRRNGAKWDVFLVNSEGRKFRSRGELRNYFGDLKEEFPSESFDFMVGRKFDHLKTKEENRGVLKKILPGSPLALPAKRSPAYKCPIYRRKRRKHGSTSWTAESKKMKSSPRIKEEEEEEEQVKSPATPVPPPPPMDLSEFKTPDGGFKCCNKNFRKENLFQMHMKHYHPEYSKMFACTPNVADLAYARTVGEPLEDSRAEAMTPKHSFSEMVSKYEAERKLPESPLAATTPSVKKEVEQSPPTVSKVKEETKKSEEKQTVPASAKDSSPTKASEVDKKDESSSKNEKAATSSKDVKSETTSEEKTKVSKKASGESSKEIKAEPAKETSQSPVAKATEISSSLPVIKPVSKLGAKSSSSEAVIVQTTSSTKNPITITKYIPPDKKPPSSLTKVTISMPPEDKDKPKETKETKPSKEVEKETTPKETAKEMKHKETKEAKVKETKEAKIKEAKEVKAKEAKEVRGKDAKPKELKDPKPEKSAPKTIKTLMPMRPPSTAENKETADVAKPKDVKTKEEVQEEVPTKSKPGRKRTASETLQKKSKLMKLSTGSLEEHLSIKEETEVPASPTNGNKSYRFSRNRSQNVPKVSLEKLNVTPDSNGRVIVSRPAESVFNPTEVDNVAQVELAADSVASQESSLENLRKEEIINCTCGYMEEDGLMIQCDLCLCWQHGMCNNIDKEADVPEKYVCSICQNPTRLRTSMRHMNNQDWIKEGKLPSLPFRPKSAETVVQRQSMLQTSHKLTGSLIQLQSVIHSLRVKTHIATKPDHPKLYLWAKSWKNENSDGKVENEDMKQEEVTGPQPEAAIDAMECRLHLLEHVEDYQQQVEDRLTSIQAQIAALESEDPDLANDDEDADSFPVTKQTMQMLMQDLQTVQQVAAVAVN